jgi:hypothetical protein
VQHVFELKHSPPVDTKGESKRMVTRAKTIKLADLNDVIDQAVEASAAKRLPGGTIIGRQIRAALAEKVDTNALARSITKQVQGSISDAKLTPKVITAGGITTIGFIMKPIKEVIG